MQIPHSQRNQVFVTKLFTLLKDDTNSDIVHWSQQKNGFKIIDIKLLEQNVLPKYFRHCKYASFVRQLNMYDFHKIRQQNGQTIFCHNKFIELNEELLNCIKRKGTSKKFSDNKQNQMANEKQRKLSYLVEQLIQELNNFNIQEMDHEQLKQKVQQLRNQQRYRTLRSRKYLKQIYEKLNFSPNLKEQNQVSIDYQIEDQDLDAPFKSLSFLKSQGFIKKVQSLFYIDQ